jgi:hypothetical protein
MQILNAIHGMIVKDTEGNFHEMNAKQVVNAALNNTLLVEGIFNSEITIDQETLDSIKIMSEGILSRLSTPKFVDPDNIKILRVIEYSGPRDLVEECVRQSVHGERVINRPRGRSFTIRVVTLGEIPEIFKDLPKQETEASDLS